MGIKNGMEAEGEPGAKGYQEYWVERCAWCARKLAKNRNPLSISIRLRPEAFSEVEPGTIEPLFLPGVDKKVPMFIGSEDSPLKAAGKDAIFQLCSRPCAESLQAALKAELGG